MTVAVAPTVVSTKPAYVFGFVQPTSLDFSKYSPKESVAKYGGKLIRREILTDSVYSENTKDYKAAFVLQFPSLDKALQWYNSDEYKEQKKLRLATSKGPLVIAEGEEFDEDNTKGLVMGFFKVTDPEVFKTYAPQASMKAYDFKPIARVLLECVSVVEEGNDFTSAGLFGFATAKMALDWVNSEEYKEAKAVRLASTMGHTVILGDK